MKIKKLVRVIAKSDFMDVDTTMVSSKATAFVKKLKKIHTLQIDALRVERKIKYRKGFEIKNRIVREYLSQSIIYIFHCVYEQGQTIFLRHMFSINF